MKRTTIVLALLCAGTLSAGPAAGHGGAEGAHAHGGALAPGSPLPGMSIYHLESEWTDDRGRPFQLASLRGRPVAMAMIYTSCTYVCPLIVEALKRVEHALPGEARGKVQFLLVSFDPQRDTVQALAAYRGKRHLPEHGWTLLRGAPGAVLELAAVLGVRYRPDGKGDFAHSNLLTVLDAQGRVSYQQVGLAQGPEGCRQALLAALR